MSKRPFPWIAAGVGTALLVVAGVALVRQPSLSPAKTPSKLPDLDLSTAGTAQGDKVLEEQLALFDPTPLFLPTHYNYSSQALPAELVGEPGKAFSDFPSKSFFGADVLKLGISDDVKAPASPVEALQLGQPRKRFWGMGEGDKVVAKLSPRLGSMRVTATGSGRVVLADDLSGTGEFSTKDWKPVELLIAVDPVGLVGDLVVTQSSGIEEVDAFFCDYLARVFRLGERLRPGIYEVVVGP